MPLGMLSLSHKILTENKGKDTLRACYYRSLPLKMPTVLSG
jgi:hypothetical protein